MANSFSGSAFRSNPRDSFPSVDLKNKMDALVSDLSHALDESQLPQYHRKRRGYKRRSKISSSLGLSMCMASEDSSSSIGEMTLSQDNKSSIPLSDSDELSPPPDPRMQAPHLIHHRVPPNLVESDSVNENFSPARLHNRRKQKCKRMALDPGAPSTSTNSHSIIDRSYYNSFRKKKSVRPSPDNDNRFVEVSAGKRKRGRDRNMEWDTSRKNGTTRTRHATGCHKVSHATGYHKLSTPSSSSHVRNEELMDLEYSNESNSSDSEAGIYTCDEGREADDEQSDWFAEPGAVYGVPGSDSSVHMDNRGIWWNDQSISLSPSAKALFKEKYERMSQESQHACRLRFQKLRERLMRREIRAGRRRLQERRPGFSIVSSVNDKVSKFLQDPKQMELRLKPMSERDRDQLKHLANLYSLNVRPGDDHTAPILTKTRKTITARQLDSFTLTEGSFSGGIPVPVSDMKRRRRTPPPNGNNMTEGSNDSIESVIASAGNNGRPPVPIVSWDDDDVLDSLSERLADSEPEPLPSPSSLGLNDCTL